MKKNQGFTLIELMIVIAIIAIIAAIAIPNLMQSRIRANEATAVTVVKGYATAQVTFQVGRQGRETVNTDGGNSGFCDNYRNLFYGVPVNQVAGTDFLQLISQTHADAATDDDDNGTTTVGTPSALAPYQGYRFQSPTGMTVGAGTTSWFETQFAQIAIPMNSTSTGTNAYFVGIQGQVWMQGLTANQDLTTSIGDVGAAADTPLDAAAIANWNTL